MLHLFGHSHQGSRVLETEGIFMSNGAQYFCEKPQPIIFDINLSADIPKKTKLYKQTVWKENDIGSAESVQSNNKSCILS